MRERVSPEKTDAEEETRLAAEVSDWRCLASFPLCTIPLHPLLCCAAPHQLQSAVAVGACILSPLALGRSPSLPTHPSTRFFICQTTALVLLHICASRRARLHMDTG